MTRHPLDGSAIAADAHYGRDDQIGTDEGDTCNRNGCDGMIGPDDEGTLMCGVCECRADETPDDDHLYEQARDRAMERGE